MEVTHPMLVLLPLIGFLLLAVRLGIAVRSDQSAGAWERSLLLAAAYWGALAVALVEVLGAARSLTSASLALGWAVADLVLAALTIKTAQANRGWRAAWRPPRLSRAEGVFGILLAGYLSALLVVALASPPNNTDSLQYHMARVAHWIQNRSLAHYATQYEPQLFNPPGAEILILTLQVVFGSDRLANLVQWAAFLGALTAVSGISRALGLGNSGRMVAIGFAAVVPMAVLQATSTQNDLVGAFWLLTFAYFVTQSQLRAFSTAEWAATGLALGLSILTKTTQYVYGLPFLILLVARGWKGNRPRRLGQLTIVLGLAAVLCLPAWWRNQSLFGTLLGPPDLFEEHSVAVGGAGRVLEVPLRGLRMILINFTSHSPTATAWAADAVRALYASLGLEAEDPLFVFAWNHEDLAGSPLHVLAAGFAGIIVLARWKQNRTAGQYAACVIAGYLLLPWMLTSISRPFMIRHQLPFYLAGAPLVAFLLDRSLSSRSLSALSNLILLLGLPWLVFNNTRPLVGLRPGAHGGLEFPCPSVNLQGYECTRIGSVLTMPKVDILFANLRDEENDTLAIVEALEQTGCTQVGLRIDSHDPEYVIWHLLKAPQSGYHLETIYTVPRLEPLINRNFSPCAIICTICGERQRLHGLDLYHEAGGVKLFAGGGFTWNPDG